MGLKMGWIAQSVFPPAGAPEVDFLEWLVESMNAAVLMAAARNLGQPQVAPWRAAGAPPPKAPPGTSQRTGWTASSTKGRDSSSSKGWTASSTKGRSCSSSTGWTASSTKGRSCSSSTGWTASSTKGRDSSSSTGWTAFSSSSKPSSSS